MTFKDKLREDCPGLSEEAINSIVACMCPYQFRYEHQDAPCFHDVDDCIECWNREIPGTRPVNKTTLEPPAPRQEDISHV
jgi:hypothetical protein